MNCCDYLVENLSVGKSDNNASVLKVNRFEERLEVSIANAQMLFWP
jgi:hypothetical protein